MFMFLFVVAVYIFSAVCLQRIAQKTGRKEPAWYAWVPIVNLVLLCRIAGKAWWWVLLMLIPILNIIFGIIVWWKVCEACKKPGWLSLIIVLVPIGNFIAMGVLAFSKE